MSEVPIRLLSREEFSRLLRAFKATAGTRRINSVHIHHTWIPNYDHFDRQKQRLGSAAAAGRELCANMRRSHMNDRGFRDIAQHLTIDPEGNLYLGRAWNLSPASALGFNGSAQVGPFMIEMIGDFDVGRNKMTVAQREATVWVTATVNAAYDLAADSIRFHNEMAAKSCPGTSQSRATWVAEVARGMKATDPTLGQPFDARYVELQTLSLKDALSEMVAVSRDLKDEGELPSCSRDAAVANDFIEPIDSAWLGQDDDLPSGRGGPKLSDQDLREVRPHIINMRQGRFSNDGIVQSTLASVTDQMSSNFGHWARARHAAGQPVRVMFFAHGGLVSEKNAVAYAVATREFWLTAGVWPFFFVWETGPLETLAQIFSRSRQSGTRAARGDLDRVWEGIASGPGTKLWETMKLSAERSGQPDGAGSLSAVVYAETLEVLKEVGVEVETHCIGHSAGSILHNYFVPALVRNEVTVASVQYLAAAVRIDAFRNMMMGADGGIANGTRFRCFLMNDRAERRDHTMGVIGYRQSLLFAVSNAFEGKRETPLLGMERYFRADNDLLEWMRTNAHQLIVTPTGDAGAMNSAQADTHGAFDNEPDTMSSVRAFICGGDVPAGAIEIAVGRSGNSDPWGLEGYGSLQLLEQYFPIGQADNTMLDSSELVTKPPSVSPSSSGSRRALCIGINAYPPSISPLSGCVADSQSWGDLFERRRYDVQYLHDAKATRRGILDAIGELLDSARPGDMRLLQFAGHGTTFADHDGDEQSGSDQALVPVDAETAGCLLDDEMYEFVIQRLKSGVTLVGFFDCCHSGSNTRLSSLSSIQPNTPKARFIVPNHLMLQAQGALMARTGRSVRPQKSRSVRRAPYLSFAACQDEELAMESNGAGHFTTVATSILKEADQISPEALLSKVTTEFTRRKWIGQQRPKFETPESWSGSLLP